VELSLNVTRRTLALAVCVSPLAGGGCAAARAIEPTSARTHVIIFPGICGPYWGTAIAERSMERELGGATAQVFEWTSLLRRRWWLANLTDYRLNAARAECIAQQLIAWRSANPEAKLFLIGLSGGAGIILRTCESLPENFSVEGIVLLSGAVSPHYDLTRALTLSRRGILAYRSERDVLMLDWGTRLFGTIDGYFGRAAGHVGFQREPAPALRAKLRQIRWTPGDILHGNWGGHIGSLASAYFRRTVLPFLQG
jgi:pimeloyl-ACP methyl ester carboxylesterase